MFGNLVGYGDYGFVYEDETEINGPDGSVVKILNLNNPCNLQQYNMFIQLQNHQDQGIRTPGLPFVFQTFRGIMNPNILNILSYATTDAEARRQVRSTLPAGSEYGIINMERLPCIAQNQFCGRNLKDKGNQVEEQSIYEAMVTYLYDSGWWVRDLIDPRNIGYNIHGEPIWFDPMVARRQGFPGFSQQALEQCHEEVVAYPTSYRKAIESGRYFTERHGYGLFNSEAQTSTELLHQAKNWPLISSTDYKGFFTSMPSNLKILNSWEEWESMDKEDQFGKWYYINWPCTVYRGSLKRGIDYETYLEDTAIKPSGISMNMGYRNIIAAAPEMSEALIYGAFSVSDVGDIVGHEASELYAFDIQDYVVTFPRWSTQGRSGRNLPVIFIAGGVYHDDAILLWEKEDNAKWLNSENMNVVCGNCNWSWKRSDGGDDPFVCHKCYFDNETYHSEAMNEAMFEKRYGWKVGSADNLSNRSNDFPISINFAYYNFTQRYTLGDLFGSDSYVSREYPPCYLCGKPAKLDVMTAIGRRQFCSNRCRGEYEGVDYGEYPSEELEHSLEIVNYYPGYKEWDYQEDSTIDVRCRNCDWRTSQQHSEHTHTWDSYKQSFYSVHPTNTMPVFDEDGDFESYEECKHDMFIIKYLGREEYEDSQDPRAGNIVVGCRNCKFKDTLDHVNIPAGCSNRGREKPMDLSRFFGAEYNWDDIEWTTNSSPPEEWGINWDDNYRSTTGIFYSPAGRIGLQLRSQLVLSPNTWSGISGFLDAGETPYDAVVREIHEESGLPVDTIKQWNHKVIWDDGSHRTYLFYVDTEFEPEVNEFKWEWDDWRWATLDAWKQVPNLHPGMEAALNLTQQTQ